MAFFFSVFLHKSQTASIAGYLIAVWFTTIASTFNLTIYNTPNKLDWFFYPFPPFAFCRMMYLIANSCGNEHCLKGFYEFDDEM
jgi:hypothetical protein